ncbi:MAG: MFS transporter [Alphaproteobacteria bacterium]|nr:MFS transporter [Alphaproteobacteria bacterium]
MLVFFRSHQEVIPRTYDTHGGGFSPLPLKKVYEDEKFHWTLGLVRDLGAVFSSIFLSAVGYGILMVLIAFKLEYHVQNEILMSLSAMTQIGAGVIFSRFLPAIGRKVGLIVSIYVGSLVSAFCTLLLYKYFNYFFWILTIFGLGTSLFTCGVTRFTLMIGLAPPHVRAIIISLGTMLVAIGNSIGVVLLNLMETGEEFISFVITALFYLTSMLPLYRLEKIDSTVREEKKISIWRYIKNSPKIMFAGFSVSYAMSSASAFLIIYGIKIGMPQNHAALLLSVLLFGTILYIPAGYLTDLLNRRMLMISGAVMSLICVYLLYSNYDLQRMHALLFLMFGCLSCMKLPAIILINEKYKPTQRLAVNSAFSRMSLVGNICGLLITGMIMKLFGASGLWVSLMIILTAFLIFCCANYIYKIIRGEFDLKNFSILNKHQNEQLQEV